MTEQFSGVSSTVIEAAVRNVGDQIANNRDDKDNFHLTERNVFRELAACILGSQVTFEQALAATNRLRGVEVIRAVRSRTHRASLIRSVQNALRGRVDECIGYRFWRTRSVFIVDCAFEIYRDGDGLVPMLRQIADQKQGRECVVALAKGIGPKQASLFLRNVGFGGELAILDRHVLRFMHYVGLIRELPRSISNIREYEALEHILSVYARGFGWGLQILDQAVWISMRVAQKMTLCPSLR